MEAELKETLDIEVELVPSDGGVFEIALDGSRLFSKKEVKRFPEEGEVAELLRRVGVVGR